MHSNVSRPELVCEITARGFQRRLHRSHDIVVRDHFIGAIVAHREHGAAVAHQRRRKLGHANEGVAGHIHRLGEPACRAVEQPALQVLLRGESDGVDQNVEPAPLAPDGVKHCLQLTGRAHVQCSGYRRIQLSREGLDKLARLFVQPRNGDVRAGRAECLGAAIGDRLVVSHADDQRFVTGENRPDVVAHR